MRACIERVDRDRISGWAINDSMLDERLQVRLVLDGQAICEVIADGFRADLERNAVGDGRYGFVFPVADWGARLPPTPDLASLLLNGRVGIAAENRAGQVVAAVRAPYLESVIRQAKIIDLLENATFDQFLAAIAEDQALLDGKVPAVDLFNASRAHFPEWADSTHFIELAIKAAQEVGARHTERFYQRRLHRLLAGAAPPPPDGPPADDQAPPTYGTLFDWVAGATVAPCRLRRARLLGGADTASFLEEAGILRDSADAADAVEVLAYREYGFHHPTWSVLRQGKHHLATRNLYYLDFEQLLTVLSGGGVLIVDASCEGPNADPERVAILNQGILDLELPADRILYATQNLQFGKQPGAPALLFGVVYAHFYICRGLAILKRQFPSDHAIRQHCVAMFEQRANAPATELRHYICMNFTPRWHRWVAVLYLYRRGLLAQGYVSFPGEKNIKMKAMAALEKTVPAIPDRADLLAAVPDLLNLCPMTLDAAADAESPPDFDFPFALMARSLLHFVTESEVTDGFGVKRVTEKILKPIVGLQPFLVIGNPQSLRLLQDMGFRTFDGLFDEGYDLVADPGARIGAIFKQIDNVTSMPIDALRQRVAGYDEILIHNLVHLLSVGPLLFNDAAGFRIHRAIETIRQRDSAPPR
jgi:hypothetical protein